MNRYFLIAVIAVVISLFAIDSTDKSTGPSATNGTSVTNDTLGHDTAIQEPSSPSLETVPTNPAILSSRFRPTFTGAFEQDTQLAVDFLNTNSITPLTEIREYGGRLFPTEVGLLPYRGYYQGALITNVDLPNFFSTVVQDFQANRTKIYEIAPKNLVDLDTYLFEINQYFFDLDISELGEARYLCERLKDMNRDRVPYQLISDLVNGLSIDFPLKPGVVTVSVSPSEVTGNIVADLIILSLFAKRSKIFVRGSADRCRDGGNCAIGMLDNRYLYSSIDIHRTIDQGLSLNRELSGFRDYTEEITIPTPPNSFTNEDLPNLRAKFFAEDILERLVSQCDISYAIQEVGILEGEVDDNLDELERKVQVFLMLNEN